MDFIDILRRVSPDHSVKARERDYEVIEDRSVYLGTVDGVRSLTPRFLAEFCTLAP